MSAAGYNTISDENPGLRTYIDGKEDGPVIVFVHGWPDDHALWDKQVCRAERVHSTTNFMRGGLRASLRVFPRLRTVRSRVQVSSRQMHFPRMCPPPLSPLESDEAACRHALFILVSLGVCLQIRVLSSFYPPDFGGEIQRRSAKAPKFRWRAWYADGKQHPARDTSYICVCRPLATI